MPTENVIRTVLFKEGDWWVAQCLDVDIAAQAHSEKELYDELWRLLIGRILVSERLGVEPFASLPPAPKRYWDMFFKAQPQPKATLPFNSMDDLPRSLPELELRAA